jgi:cytochrome bd ubiquinol oxidase subunit II
MDLAVLQVLFYLVIIAAIIMYTILDGFDLGVGMLHLFTKKDHDRRVFLNAIGPVWDGNEVWLVIIVGGTFAGFPIVYASVLSSFYLFTVVLLGALMFRAAAIEFRSKKQNMGWRHGWDRVFSIASFMVALLIGIGLGNFIQGMPLNSDYEFYGDLSFFFRLYPFIIGVFGVSLFIMHGNIFLLMKTEGELHNSLRNWSKSTLTFFGIMLITATLFTFAEIPHMVRPHLNFPPLFIIPALMVGAYIYLCFMVKKENDGIAFITSSLLIFLLMTLFAIGTFPYLVYSTVSPETNSLTVFNSSSSKTTLKVLMSIAMIGIPLVFAYGIYVYRVFRGKVQIDESSY